MAAAVDVKTIKPRSKFDRQLALIEQQIVWEHSSESVRENLAAKNRLAELAEQALRIGDSEGATPTIKLRAISVAQDCIRSACDIRTGTIIDRTIPALSRSEVSAVLATLPLGVDEMSASAPPAITDEELSRRESIELLRDAISLLEAGGAKHPGLVLLRSGDAA